MVVIYSPEPLCSEHRISVYEMAHWLHCNSCYVRPGNDLQRRFFITNCSHIYCEECVTSSTKEKCKVCQAKCSTLLLSGKMPKEVEILFADPSEHLMKLLKQQCQIVEFQNSHQRRLLRHFSEKTKAYERQLREVKNVIVKAHSMERDFIKMKAENDYLKLLLSKKDPRGGSKSFPSPGGLSASPSQGSPAFGRHQNFTNIQQKTGSTSNIMNQPGRILIRTPPSGGRMGTTGSGYAGTNQNFNHDSSSTPLTVPRPIQFNNKD